MRPAVDVAARGDVMEPRCLCSLFVLARRGGVAQAKFSGGSAQVGRRQGACTGYGSRRAFGCLLEIGRLGTCDNVVVYVVARPRSGEQPKEQWNKDNGDYRRNHHAADDTGTY